MNILHIEDEPWDSGIAHYALSLAQALKDRGHDVHFWGKPGSVPVARARNLRLDVRELRHPWLDLGHLRAWVRRNHVDVINAHTGKAQSLAVALAAGTRIPVVRTRGDARPARGHALSRVLAMRTAAFIGANTDIYARLKSVFRFSRVVFVPQGIAAPKPAPLEKSPRVGILGRLDPVKGHEDFIAAAALLKAGPATSFVAAGGGRPERLEQLRALARQRAKSRPVEFLGFVDDSWRFIADCRIGVVASTGSEAVSRAALEWMSQGRPVVATTVGGLPDIVEDGVTGILVPPRDPAELASALRHLLERPEEAERLGAEARRRFEARFGLERFAVTTERLYEELLQRHPS